MHSAMLIFIIITIVLLPIILLLIIAPHILPLQILFSPSSYATTTSSFFILFCTVLYQARHARALSASELRNLLKESSSQVDSNESTSSSSSSKSESRSESESETVIEELSVRQSVRDAINRVALEYAHAKNNQKSTDITPLPAPVVIVCGTAFIMAETRAELGVIEPKDSDSLSDASSPTGHVDSQVRSFVRTNLHIYVQDLFKYISLHICYESTFI